MILPNFFILGAQKSGTTWLWRNLSEHKDIYMHPNEVHYFDKAYNLQKGIDWYAAHFREGAGCRAIGEKTPEYLWANAQAGEGHNPNVHEDLNRQFPDAKYIVVLRNPVDRARSGLIHSIRTRRLPLTIPIDRLFERKYEAALSNLGVLERGYYAEQIEAWYSLIEKERMLILIYERDTLKQPRETLAKVCEFIGVDPEFRFPWVNERKYETPKTYQSLIEQHQLRKYPLHRKWFESVFSEKRLNLKSATLNKLRDHYRPHNDALYELLGYEIDEWEGED